MKVNTTGKSQTSDEYIIAFARGSSGRFAKYSLTNLLINEPGELKICPISNSTHKTDQNRYTGYTFPKKGFYDPKKYGNSHPAIWHLIEFDNVLREPGAPKIFPTHVFPDFKLIQNRLGPDVKIIIITLDPKDLVEVVVNDKLKNYHDVITGTVEAYPGMILELQKHYERFLGKPYPAAFVKEDIIEIGKGLAGDTIEDFLKMSTGNPDVDSEFYDRIGRYLTTPDDIDYPQDQLLLLPYHEMSEQVNGEYVWLTKLEKFTGKTANAVTKAWYQKYVDGRTKLLKEYRL